MTRKTSTALLLGCALLSLTATGFAGTRPTNIAIGTAAAGGAWYPIGAAMADIITTSKIGTQATVQTTGGGIENSKLVQDGDCELAINLSYLAYNAYKGLKPYSSPMTNIRGMFGGLSTGIMQLLVPGGSPIKTFADLKGKKVAVGPAGGGAITALEACLEKYGVKYSEISPSYVSYDEGVTMMTDGSVHAAIVYGGIPTPAVKSLEASGKSFTLISLTEAEQKAVVEQYPFFVPIVITKQIYDVPQPVYTVGTPNIVICNANLSDDFVYDVCKLFFAEDNLKKIRASQPSARELSLEGAPKVPIPMHPGAEKYFREVGAIK